MHRFRSKALLFLLGMCFVLGGLRLASAQSSVTGAITGIVTDQSGAVIVGANVKVVNIANNAEVSTTTDSGGRFLAGLLQPSTYNVEVSAAGFGTHKYAAIIVEVGRSTTVDATLKPATTESVITTTAEAPVVETDRSDFSTNINAATMDNSPVNTRRWSTFALTTPGASADGTFGLISFRGISGLLNNNTVDGGDNNQAFFAEEKGRTRISYSISEDSVQEFQVNTSNYSAEYGRAAGGVVNAVTKSGTNHFHGTAYWYYRDSDIGATNPFTTQSILVNGVATIVPIKPPDRRHQFGGNLGGTIIKDKLFFFFNADQQLRNFPGVASPSSPAAFFSPLTASELSTLNGRGVSAAQANGAFSFLQTLTGNVSRRGDELILFPKIDWNVTPKNRASFEYNRMRWSSPAGIQTAAVVFRGVDSFGDDFVKDDTGIARLTSTLSPTLVNEARFSYGRDFEFETGQPAIAGEPVSSQGVSPQITISGASGFVFGKPNFLDRAAYPDERRLQVADSLSWSRGQHLLKFGADINHVNDILNNLFQGAGAYSYTNRADYITDFVAYTNNPSNPGKLCAGLPCYSSFNQGFGPPAFEFHTWDLGFFANDDWRIAPRLTITAGLRWEYEKLPQPQVPNSRLPATAVFPSDKGDFGPRLGFALDLGGSQRKMVLRGGYGIYFGRIINSTISNAITNTGSTAGQLQFSFRNNTGGAPVYPNVLDVAPPPNPNAVPNVVIFAPATKLPLVHEYDVTFEREIADNTAISVAYLGSQGRRLPIFIDTNLAVPTSTITYTVSGGPLNGQSFTLPLFTARLNPQFGAITNIEDVVQSRYNAAVVGFNRRFTHGLQVQVSYTYAHANDNGQSSQTFSATNNVVNPYALSLEQGRSIFETRHRVAGSAVWQPAYFHNKGTLAHWLLDGFSFSPVFGASSGFPYSGFVSGNATGVPASCIGCTGIIGAGGSARPPFVPRDTFLSPNSFDVDLRVGKKFWYKERATFELLTDFFNLFNRVNPTQVSGALVNSTSSQYTISGRTLNYQPTFGNVIATSSSLAGPGQRQIQIGAKLTW